MANRLLNCTLLLGLTTSLMATPMVGTHHVGYAPVYAADLLASDRHPPSSTGGFTPPGPSNPPSSPPGSFVPPGPSACPSGVRYVQAEDDLWYTTTEFAAAMRGDDSIIGRASLTPAQQRCTSTPPPTGFTPPPSSPPSNPPGTPPSNPPTFGGACPPAQQYIYVDDALGYLTLAQIEQAERTGVLPDGLPSIPASGCAPPSSPPSGPPATPPSTPPTFGGSCPPAQRYVYVDDALGYLTIAQRDEAMRTGIIPDGLQHIPESGCAPSSTPPPFTPPTSTPPGTPPSGGGFCPPSRQYVYVDDALGYLTLEQIEIAENGGPLPDGLPSIPASACSPSSTPPPATPPATPPSSPPTFGGSCPPAQRYVYVDDALGYLTVAQRDEAMRTGIIPDGLQSIPASGCASSPTPPTSTPPVTPPSGGGFCPPSRQYVYVDDALGYLTLEQIEIAENGGPLPDGLPSIPASACTPSSTPPLSTPPATPPSTPPTFGGSCPPAQRYVYVDDALGYLTVAQRDEAMRTGIIPDGLQHIPESGCASSPTPPTSTPPATPPASGGFCPPSRQYVYVDDALGYLTVAQRDEALRTGELPDGLPAIPADACTPSSTPPTSNPPATPPASGGFCPPSRQYVYVDDALGYLTVAQRDEALRTGELPDGLPTIPADACTPGQPGTVASTPPSYPGGNSCEGGFFPMEGGGLFDDEPDFAPMSEASSYSSAYCAPHYGGSFYASFSGGLGVVDFSTTMNNTSVDIFSTIVSGSASDADAIGSLRAGYDHAFPTQMAGASAITIGVFIDQTFGELAATTSDIDPDANVDGRITSTVNMLGSLNARAGLAFGMALPYVTAGVSWAEVDAVAFDPTAALAQNFSSQQAWGWNFGAGVEYFITPQWTSWAEVRYHSLEADFPGVTNNPSSFDPFTIDYSITTVQAGVSYRF